MEIYPAMATEVHCTARCRVVTDQHMLWCTPSLQRPVGHANARPAGARLCRRLLQYGLVRPLPASHHSLNLGHRARHACQRLTSSGRHQHIVLKPHAARALLSRTSRNQTTPKAGGCLINRHGVKQVLASGSQFGGNSMSSPSRAPPLPHTCRPRQPKQPAPDRHGECFQ